MSYQSILDKLGSKVRDHTRAWFEHHKANGAAFLGYEFSDYAVRDTIEFGKYMEAKTITAVLIYTLNEGI